MVRFLRKDDGLVTIEWVGIAAVMVLAAVAITAYVLQASDGTGGRVADGLDSIEVESDVDLSKLGNGQRD